MRQTVSGECGALPIFAGYMGRNTLFHQFFRSEKSGGLVLIVCTGVSLLLANLPAGSGYRHFWHLSLPIGSGSAGIPFNVEAWINDGLMTIFFLLVGLEIRRELVSGELASRQKALLPVLAALGGMLLPALIHFMFNRPFSTRAGFGIPMATDIAFSLAVLSLAGKRVPISLKVFLTALAIIDDLGAVIVIAAFYTVQFSWLFLLLGLGLTAMLALISRTGLRSLRIYLPAGVILWYFLYRSGIHPTLSGVLLAFVIPFRAGEKGSSPAETLEHALQKPVAFLIVPLFALANTAISLPRGWIYDLRSPNSLGIILGLVAGKCAGIAVFSLLAIKAGLSVWPEGMNTKKLMGVGMLGGIGFTMSIFISHLAFPSEPAVVDASKVAVLLASLFSALGGWAILRSTKN